MSTQPESRLLHVRSLNHLAREHPFTYVGARILAESLHPSIIEAWTNEYITRKTQTGRRQVYWEHSLFKGFGCEGEPEHRDCVIGSPTTHLTEAWLLRRLSQDQVFALHPCVYSYSWSEANSSHIFQYFFDGYMERECKVAQTAAERPGSLVVVLDLKKFYPTINVARMKSRFKDRLSRSGLAPLEQDAAIRCVEELTSIKHVLGLPIGPALSHALANIFLADFDSAMSKNFPGAYFRYVDDIALVVPKSEVDSAMRFVDRAARDEELEVNHDKTDILTGEKWAARVRHRERASQDPFRRLIDDVRLYLAHNTSDFDRVKDLFQAKGFALPFTRLQAVASSSSRFRQSIKSFWSQTLGLFGRSILRPPALLERAENLRREFEDGLHRKAEQPLPGNGMARRWAIQDLRYLLNRSLYLVPPQRRAQILDILPDCPELRPSRTVVEALVTGDASEVTKYPGPTVSAFCELWSETTKKKPTLRWPSNPTKQDRDGASVLALWELCKPPEEWTKQLREEKCRVMVNLASGYYPARRSFDDFSYIDEMESLFLKPGLDAKRILTTRFSDGEDVFLPTLSLGGSQSMS